MRPTIRVVIAHRVGVSAARRLGILALLLLVAVPPAASQTSPTRMTYELRGGQWWTGESFEPRTMYSTEGVFSTTRPATVDSVIDLGGFHIVPPFAEAHTHTIAYVPSRIDEFIDQGVFYALVMSVHRSFIGESFTRFNRPRTVDVNFASRAVTASDGHPVQIGLRGDATMDDVDGDWITVIESVGDIEARWPEIEAANPDLVKIFLVWSERYHERHGDASVPMRYKGMDPALAAPVIERAHAAGLRVAAHVRTARDFEIAVDGGADIIAHLPGFSMGAFAPEALHVPDRVLEIENPEWFRITEAAARNAAERRVTVIPTIGGLGSVPESLDPETRRRLRQSLDRRNEVVASNLRLLHETGVRIAVGSDAGEGSPVTEALVMRDLGVFTNAEILKMLSENAPRVTFPRRSIGRLADGYEASFLALAGDPTVDLDHIRDVRLRFKQGHLITR